MGPPHHTGRWELHFQVVQFVLQVIKVLVAEEILINCHSSGSSLCTLCLELGIRGVIQTVVHDTVGIKFNFMDLK